MLPTPRAKWRSFQPENPMQAASLSSLLGMNAANLQASEDQLAHGSAMKSPAAKSMALQLHFSTLGWQLVAVHRKAQWTWASTGPDQPYGAGQADTACPRVMWGESCIDGYLWYVMVD